MTTTMRPHILIPSATLLLLLLLLLLGTTGCDFSPPHEELKEPGKLDTQRIGVDTSDATTFFDPSSVPQSSGYLPEESGDVAAREYQSLQRYLPSMVDGFDQAAPLGGSQQEMDGFKLTSAEQQWLSSDGTERMKIIITDCGAKEGGYALGTSLYFPALATGKDTTVREFKDASGAGETVTLFSRKSKTSQVTLGVRGRYIIDIKSVGSEGDRTPALQELAKNVAEGMSEG